MRRTSPRRSAPAEADSTYRSCGASATGSPSRGAQRRSFSSGPGRPASMTAKLPIRRIPSRMSPGRRTSRTQAVSGRDLGRSEVIGPLGPVEDLDDPVPGEGRGELPSPGGREHPFLDQAAHRPAASPSARASTPGEVGGSGEASGGKSPEEAGRIEGIGTDRPRPLFERERALFRSPPDGETPASFLAPDQAEELRKTGLREVAAECVLIHECNVVGKRTGVNAISCTTSR